MTDNDTITITIRKPPGGEFKLGDNVLYGEHKAVITSRSDDRDFPIVAKIESTGELSFTIDGKEYIRQSYPALSFISRPDKLKKKVKKTIERWANVYDDGLVICASVKDALQASDDNGVRAKVICVKLTGSYEEEVEE